MNRGEFSHWLLERIRGLNTILEKHQSHSAEPEVFLQDLVRFLARNGFCGVSASLSELPRPVSVQEGELKENRVSWPIAVQEHVLGKVVASPEEWLVHGDENFAGEALEILVEVADSVLYAAIRAQWKHSLVLEVRRDFLAPVLEDGIRMALARLRAHVPVQKVLVLYRDFGILSGGDSWAHLLYEDGMLVHSPASPHPELQKILGNQQGDFLKMPAKELLLEEGEGVMDLFLDSSTPGKPIGRLLVSLKPEAVNAFSHDMMEILGVGLEEILDGHRRDKLELLRHFPDEHCDRLLRSLPYEPEMLHPKLRDCGMLYADLDGFTTLSEKVFREPEQIAGLIETWARKMINIVYSHNGVYDKLVGDCVIGLFGPPWYEDPRREILAQLLACAREMIDATRSLPEEVPWIGGLLEKSGVPGLEVAIGLNFGPAFVGRMGADRSYTALSQTMNAAARLQGLAEGGEVIVPAWFEGQESISLQGFSVAERCASQVKGVERAIEYLRLYRNR